MKNPISLLLKINVIILLVLVTSACSNTTQSVKVGLLLPTLSEARFKEDLKEIEAYVKKEKGELVYRQADNNEQKQIIQGEEILNEGIDVLIVMCVNKITATTIVRSAQERGIKVVAYDRIISNCDLDCFVSFDNVKVGELMAQYAVKEKPGGEYIVLNGDKRDQNAIWVKEGFHNVIDKYIKDGSINVLYETFIEDWSKDHAYFEMTQVINSIVKCPDAILSAYDGLSTGAINALAPLNPDIYPVVTGQNAELDACRDIMRGKQTMTIYKPIRLEAENAVRVSMQFARNEKVNFDKFVNNGYKEVPSILIEPISVDKSNLMSTVVADGFIKEEELLVGHDIID